MPRLCSISRLSLIALLLAAFGSVAWAKPKVAVLGLEVTNSGAVDPKDAKNAAALTEELRKNTGKYELAPNSNRELQDEKLMGNCDTEKPTCMAPIGGGLGADYLIWGKLEKSKDGYKAQIKILNVKDKKIEEVSETFVSTSQITSGSLKDWSGKVYAKLSGEKAAPTPTERGTGKLLVKIGNTKTGKVSIDDQAKGQLQDGTFTITLSEGAHRLEIEATDRKTYTDTVMISNGQTQTVAVDLDEIAGKPLPPPGGHGSPGWRKVMWTSVGVGLVAGGVWVYGGTVKLPQINRDLCGKDQCAKADPPKMGLSKDDQDALTSKGNTWEAVTFTMGGIVAVSAVLVGVGAWKGYFSKGSSEKRETSEVGRRKRRELTVTPVIAPNGGGATVRFDW